MLNVQVFTEYQGVCVKINDVVYRCIVEEVSVVSPGETTSSMAKRGILCSTTSVLVDVSDPHLVKLPGLCFPFVSNL